MTWIQNITFVSDDVIEIVVKHKLIEISDESGDEEENKRDKGEKLSESEVEEPKEDITGNNDDELDEDDYRKSISIIITQAKEQYDEGQIDECQYNALLREVVILYADKTRKLEPVDSLDFQL